MQVLIEVIGIVLLLATSSCSGAVSESGAGGSASTAGVPAEAGDNALGGGGTAGVPAEAGGNGLGGGNAGTSAETGGGAGDDAMGGNGGNDGGAGGDSGNGGAASAFQVGEVRLSQFATHAPLSENVSYGFIAEFTNGEEPFPTPGTCSFLDDGPCRVIDCQDDGASTRFEAYSAGQLEVLGGLSPLSLEPNELGWYPSASGEGPLWNGGETLTVKASGDEVPPFETQLRAPVGIIVTAPSMAPFGSPTILSTSSPLSVAWSGDQQGTISVDASRFEQSAGWIHRVSVRCTFDASEGFGTIPAELLQSIPPGENGSFYVDVADTKQLDVGGRPIVVSAHMLGNLPDGRAAQNIVTYE